MLVPQQSAFMIIPNITLNIKKKLLVKIKFFKNSLRNARILEHFKPKTSSQKRGMWVNGASKTKWIMLSDTEKNPQESF